MPIPMQKFREAVFQMLYSYDMGYTDDDDVIELVMGELAITKKVARDAQQRVFLIKKHIPKIDEMITNTSKSYEFERIQSVERNVLRLGIFELLFDDAIPPKVALAEAMRLTRKFGTPEAASFVNAILDAIYKESQGEKVDDKMVVKSAKDLVTSEEIAHEASQNPVHSKNEDEEGSENE